jgi:hypothetical protein
MPVAADHIWLPGAGAVSLDVIRVDRAVQQYDPLLRFGRNEDSGQWCVFRITRGNPPLPILGFEEIPHPKAVLQRLARCDARRRGDEILNEINRHNDELRKQWEEPAKEGAAITAEAFEWGFRQVGRGKRLVLPVSRGHKKQMGQYS